jgi:hypothetical protein
MCGVISLAGWTREVSFIWKDGTRWKRGLESKSENLVVLETCICAYISYLNWQVPETTQPVRRWNLSDTRSRIPTQYNCNNFDDNSLGVVDYMTWGCNDPGEELWHLEITANGVHAHTGKRTRRVGGQASQVQLGRAGQRSSEWDGEMLQERQVSPGVAGRPEWCSGFGYWGLFVWLCRRLALGPRSSDDAAMESL